QDYPCVSQTLSAVVLGTGQRGLAQSEVVQYDLPCFAQRVPIGQQPTPLAGDESVHGVEEAVDGKQPHEREVIRHAAGQAVMQVEYPVEPIGEEMEERHAADAHGINVV